MPNNIHNDITIDILIQLPVKSLLRFKCVCKSWRSLIEDRQFIKHQYYYKIFLSCWKGQYYYPYSINAPLQRDSVVSLLDLPSGIDHSLNRRFVNSCNGLFLLAFPKYQIVLWNPAIKESRTIPRPIPIQRELLFPAVYRLGYVSSLDNYKIVRVCPPADIEMFSTKSNSWKSIGKFPSNYYFDGDMVVVDGIVYMISHVLTEIKGFILCLCLKDEIFQTIKYPNAADDITIDSPSLYNLGECLFLTKFSNDVVDFEVWCMKKNGTSSTWIKMLAIIVPDITNIDRFWIQPVGFMKDGDMLFLREYIAHDFVVYDSKRRTLKEVKVAKPEDSLRFSWAITYAETLISPNSL